MDNSNQHASAQLYVRAEQLKTSRSLRKMTNLFSDTNVWHDHQRLQNTYKNLLVHHLSYAIEKRVEADMWNFCFKECFSQLQEEVAKYEEAPTRKPNIVDPKLSLEWFLEMASGFYSTLALEVRAANRIEECKKGDLDFICQYCLVHLGDISRYKNQIFQAEMFYRQAMKHFPAYGQSYNQIALLESNRGKNLSAVFHYVRSVALKHPFPAAATNLSRMFARITASKRNQCPEKAPYIEKFLRFHALIHQAHGLKKRAVNLCSDLSTSLTTLIATEALSSNELVQMSVINLFQLSRYSLLGSQNQVEVSKEETVIRHLLIDLTAGMLSSFLLPVYTQKLDKTLLSYFTLPAAKLLLDWIVLNDNVLEEAGFLKRPQIWPSLCKLLNELVVLVSVEFEDDGAALPEDYEVRAFSPLVRDLGDDDDGPSAEIEIDLIEEQSIAARGTRFLQLGKALLSSNVIRKLTSGNFETVERTSDPLGKVGLDVADMGLSSSSSDSDEEKSDLSASVKSCEMAKETVDGDVNGEKVLAGTRRKTRNAAMAAIMRKMSSDQGTEAQPKAKVSFNIPTTDEVALETDNKPPVRQEDPWKPNFNDRFVGINGPPPLRHPLLLNAIKPSFPSSQHDFSIPPPNMMNRQSTLDAARFSSNASSGLGRIGPNAADFTRPLSSLLFSHLQPSVKEVTPHPPRHFEQNVKSGLENDFSSMGLTFGPCQRQSLASFPKNHPQPIGSRIPTERAQVDFSNSSGMPTLTPIGSNQESVGSAYSLFSGNGVWSVGGPPLPQAAANVRNQHLLYQPGPSPLERLLQDQFNQDRDNL